MSDQDMASSESVPEVDPPQSLEDGVKAIRITEGPLDEIPCTSEKITQNSSYHVIPTPNLVRVPKLSCQERYDIYCKELKIAECRPAQVLSQVHCYLEENLMNKKWLALWKGPYNGHFRTTVDILVEVDDVCADQAHVSLFEPLVCSEPSLPKNVIEAQLDELDFTLDIVELYPVTVIDDSDSSDDDDDDDGVSKLENKIQEEVHQRFIAQVVDNARFFFEHIRRDWDDEDDGDHAFDAYLRARLRLYYDVISGLVPAPLVARYNRTMAKYFVRRKELLDYQSRIQSEGEPTNTEAVECWRKYYEVLMLSGLLQIWETLQLRADGPCFPRVLRRTKGPREDQTTVTHIVAEKLTPSMLKDFPDDAVMQQHHSPHTALRQCCEGDLIIIYPGLYSGEGFHELTETVTIRGEGDRDEIIIEAIPYDDLFVNIASADVTLQNITFVQADNTEGILRVESGHANVINCSFKCDGNGISVCEGATLVMTDSTIANAKGAGVELMPGCVADLKNNSIYNISDEIEHSEATELVGKGGVHMHVVDPPKLHLSGNFIRSEGGFGITVGRKKTSRFTAIDGSDMKSDGGDAPTMRSLNEKVDESLKGLLNVEIENNTIEEVNA
ncbi:unnamed protein product [Clavelina lepadiformis]|uniref:Right handed beta helix domain-containing protein n=1 Tax=Clavelina lepadiformis TaxID=159417 RepID=A0ABP0F4A3_CLALP